MSKINEVAPPGWGHTKAEKEKTKPWKPKSKIGGTAAAFKRALDDGRFKGLPGDKTKKEKTASMFKLMWSMKKKGDKPHYKPGTDKKYKKYQEDWKPEIEHSKLGDAVKKKAEKKRKAAADSLPPHLRLDVMKKAFASANEEVKEDTSIIRGNTSKKKVSYRGATSDHKRDKDGNIVASHYKKEKPNVVFIKKKDTRTDAQKKKHSDAVRKFDNYQKLKDKVTAKDAARKKHNQEYHARKRANEEKQITPMQDNNLFGNAYAGTPPPKKKKKLKEASFADYMAQAQAARERQQKKQDDRKKRDAEFVDRKKHGVKFYDKKGSGRIVKGRKVYD